MTDSHDKYDTTMDPCPECLTPVTGCESRPEYVRSNPEAVMAIHDPNCPHETDPDADCTCTVFVNPAPNPFKDQMIMVANWITFEPCGHRFEQSELRERGWKITQTVRPGWHAAKIAALRADAAKHGITLDT